jgi:hypothetical protein
MVPTRQLLDPQVRLGQVFAHMRLHDLEQHPLRALSARYRGDDVPQRHRQQIDRGPPGVHPLRHGEAVGDLEQPCR